jgi:hypothetical protein
LFDISTSLCLAIYVSGVFEYCLSRLVVGTLHMCNVLVGYRDLELLGSSIWSILSGCVGGMVGFGELGVVS